MVRRLTKFGFGSSYDDPNENGPIMKNDIEFDRAFDEVSKHIDKGRKAVQWIALLSFVITTSLTVRVFCFVGWVICKFMAHFGIL